MAESVANVVASVLPRVVERLLEQGEEDDRDRDRIWFRGHDFTTGSVKNLLSLAATRMGTTQEVLIGVILEAVVKEAFGMTQVRESDEG